MNNNILEVKNLSVKFNGEKVIDNLSFKVLPKDILLILGPNGAGKTVLLRALLGLLSYEGEIIWREGIKIGYVPQKLFQTKDLPLTVGDFFSLKKSVKQIPNKIKKEKILELLDLVGIKDGLMINKKMADLSFGQLQRVLIAWALTENPSVILFDEPTAGIDISGEETIYNLLHNIWRKKGLTIILVSHDLSVVYKYATDVLCLNKKKLCYGLPKEVLTPDGLMEIYGKEIKFHEHIHNND